MTENVLEVEKLIKDYGTFRAVDRISFQVPRGKVVGFLGPNGAGKTTTIQMLLGVTTSNGGQIRYFGRDFSRHQQYCLQRINFTSAFNTLMARISVQENLHVYGILYHVKNLQKKIAELLSYFEISHLRNEIYQDLSAGQKTRVNMVKSLLNDPELLLMDEPTASLDPDIADKTLSLIEDMRRSRNLAILYTSHNMGEITRICDEVIFLDRGRIVAQDTPRNLIRSIRGVQLQATFVDGKEKLVAYLQQAEQTFRFPESHILVIDTREEEVPGLLFAISNLAVGIYDIEIHKPTLEDVFLQIARGERYEAISN